MAISFQDCKIMFENISGSSNVTDLTQAQQDMNIGYARFNAAIARYFTRKQGFTNLVANQRYYQIPIDAIRVSSASALNSSGGPEYPLKQVRDEDEWRNLLSIQSYASSFLSHYFVYGGDQIGVYPLPSTSITTGLRYVYQPQDVALTKDDYSTGTVTIANGSATVTGIGTTWSQATHGNMQLQVTDGSDGNWYEITAVNSTTSLTIKTPYVGASVSSVVYRLGQLFIFPSEYDDTPVDYALSRFFESHGNPTRAKYHSDRYKESVADAIEKYSSSSSSNVITDEDEGYNPWFITPIPGL